VTTIPFVKAHEFDYSWLSPFRGQLGVYCSWGIYMLMIILVTLGCSNGTNLTDGMDGLAAGTSAIVGVALGVIAWLSGDVLDAKYLNIMYIPGAGEVAIYMAAFVGALLGFLWYNTFPAQVFMGDTGSLTIGGIIGVCAVIIHKELLLPILCGIFFVESLSVIIQTQWFKIQKRKGKRVRVFRATPIHDNFRKLDSQLDATSTYILKGWPHRPFHESKITVRFWITTIILAALTIITLKMR
jgi:phospho-N-acetylmuramoyl-pentapeptide-transferase